MKQNLIIKKLSKEHVDRILQLQEQIFHDLGQNTSILRRNTQDMFENCVEEPNLSLGMFDADQLIGIAIMVDAAGSEEDLSLHLEREYVFPLKSINLKLIMVRKEYYGIGFQRTMMNILEKEAYKRGYNLICATVSPHNLYSKNNLLRYGFIVDHTEEKYGGLVRDVCVKKIEKSEEMKHIGEKYE